MDLRLLLAIVAAVVLLLWLGSGAFRAPVAGPTPSAAPTIVAIEFPQEISADGEEVIGLVTFRDPDGDVVEARFEVVQALIFESFQFDPQVEGLREGEFEFYLYTLVPQEITLRVTLLDRAGHVSHPAEFRFRSVLSNSP
jgi:hypothetical protein